MVCLAVVLHKFYHISDNSAKKNTRTNVFYLSCFLLYIPIYINNMDNFIKIHRRCGPTDTDSR